MSAPVRYYAAASASYLEEIQAACRDLHASVRAARIWYALGLNDIVARYRGSVLGPFWITLTTAVFVLGIGFLYAGLMKVSIERYLPWMSTGLVVWGLISQTVLEGGEAFIAAGNVMRQTSLPAPIFVWRVVWRNILNFVHQAPVLIVLGLKFHYIFKINLLMALGGIILILLNLSWFSLLCAVACARFRDFKQILSSLMQLLFFLSPVLWIPSDLQGLGGKLMAANPVVHLLDVLRGPLIGQDISLFSVAYLAVSAVAGWALTLLFYAQVRRRIVHYV